MDDIPPESPLSKPAAAARGAAAAGLASSRQAPAAVGVESAAEAASTASSSGSNVELGVGAVVDGRYELVERLGGGGMGNVFKALDRLAHGQRDPDPYVAIKVLKSQWQSHQKAVLALQREAHRARRLTHANILRVHQFEQDRHTGQYFLVMELLEGRAIESMIDETGKGQPWARIAPLIGQICTGLSYAHANGIIHSDIKPSNLFLTRRREIKILDFGIAAPMPSPTGHETIMDARKLGARTPAYASLETYLGMTPHYSDDVYSLAVLTYEWLTGRHPYTRPKYPDKPVAAPAALRLGLQLAPVPRLTRHQNRVLRKALQLRRAERTQTVDEFWKGMSEPGRPEFPTEGGGGFLRGFILTSIVLVPALVGVKLAWRPHLLVGAVAAYEREPDTSTPPVAASGAAPAVPAVPGARSASAGISEVFGPQGEPALLPPSPAEIEYMGKIARIVEEGSQVPDGYGDAVLKSKEAALVSFELDRRGKVSQVSIDRPSGSAALDKLAQIIVSSGHYPPFPEGAWPGSAGYLFTIPIAFR